MSTPQPDGEPEIVATNVDGTHPPPRGGRRGGASLSAFAYGMSIDSALADLEAAAVAAWFADRYRQAAPATWNCCGRASFARRKVCRQSPRPHRRPTPSHDRVRQFRLPSPWS